MGQGEQDGAAAQAPIGVLCVDDNDLVADALEVRLRLAGGFRWLGRLPDAERLAAVAQELAPDVVLLDIDMPGKSPFVAVAELLAVRPGVRVVMVSGHIRTDFIDRAVEAGAWGYVSKNEGADVIVAAIRRVAAGEFVMGDDVAAQYGRA
ncbi:MAG TPA: response regulator transcription factor [Alphaproteobacteria bacterium]|nr:response regulator transcription factor [Alphaproteobacteria bacterium]